MSTVTHCGCGQRGCAHTYPEGERLDLPYKPCSSTFKFDNQDWTFDGCCANCGVKTFVRLKAGSARNTKPEPAGNDTGFPHKVTEGHQHLTCAKQFKALCRKAKALPVGTAGHNPVYNQVVQFSVEKATDGAAAKTESFYFQIRFWSLHGGLDDLSDRSKWEEVDMRHYLQQDQTWRAPTGSASAKLQIMRMIGLKNAEAAAANRLCDDLCGGARHGGSEMVTGYDGRPPRPVVYMRSTYINSSNSGLEDAPPVHIGHFCINKYGHAAGSGDGQGGDLLAIWDKASRFETQMAGMLDMYVGICNPRTQQMLSGFVRSYGLAVWSRNEEKLRPASNGKGGGGHWTRMRDHHPGYEGYLRKSLLQVCRCSEGQLASKFEDMVADWGGLYCDGPKIKIDARIGDMQKWEGKIRGMNIAKASTGTVVYKVGAKPEDWGMKFTAMVDDLDGISAR